MDPTQPINASSVVDATLSEEAAVTVSQLATRMEETASALQRLREQQYMKRDPVFDIDAKQAQRDLDHSQTLLWNKQLEPITRTLNRRWTYIYRAIVYDEQRGRWRISVPDGRLDWPDAAAAFSDAFSVDTSTFTWNPEEVSFTYVRGSPGLEFNLGPGTSFAHQERPLSGPIPLTIETESDCETLLENCDTVRLECGESSIGGEEDAYRVVFANKTARQTVPLEEINHDSPDEAASLEDLRRLVNEPPGSALNQSLVDALMESHLSLATQLRIMLYLTEQKDAILLPYEGTTAPFVAHLGDALDAYLTHIPQAGHAVLSRDSKPSFESFADEFPDKQHLTAGDLKSLCAWVDYPPAVTNHLLDDSTRGGRAMECLARVYDKGNIDDNAVLWCQLAGYPLAPDSDVIEQAVSDGQANWEAINEFDSAHETTMAPYLHEQMTESPYLNWRTLR